MTTKPYIRTLYIDNREPSTFSDLVVALSPLPIKFKRMPTGDFVCEDVCVERKEINDFANSIVNKRVFRQCDRMLKEFKHPYLVIHGRITDIFSKISDNAVIGTMVYFATHNISVLCLDTPEETAYAILKIFENHTKLLMVPPSTRTKKKEDATTENTTGENITKK